MNINSLKSYFRIHFPISTANMDYAEEFPSVTITGRNVRAELRGRKGGSDVCSAKECATSVSSGKKFS